VRISTTSVTYRSSLYFVLALATQSSLGNRRLRRDPSGARPHTLDIVALALATRLLVLWFVAERFPHKWLYSRGIELGTLAQSLLAGQGLSSPFGGSTGPTALLAPGYPAVIALIFRIFGSFTFAAAIAVMAMQVLFSVGTVLLIMHVAQRCFDSRTADLAGVFWAVSLPLLWMPTIFWETCLSTLLLVGMIALALRCEQKPSRSLWALMGAYCGLAALVNPALLMALLALMGWSGWQTRQTLPYSPLLGLLVLLLVFAPWPIRNARALGAFIPLRSTVGFELWMGNRAGATGFLDESVFPLFNRREYDQYVAKGEVAYMRDKSALAKSYIRAHPAEFLRLSSVRFARFWAGTGSKGGSILFAIHALLTSCLGAMGMWRLWQGRRFGVAALFLLPLMLFPLPYYITHAEFRYRLVIDPLLTILAASAFGTEKV
jgi:4-amino-4-deoxy-L-arabinose transferase-like glycosyltransferase